MLIERGESMFDFLKRYSGEKTFRKFLREKLGIVPYWGVEKTLSGVYNYSSIIKKENSLTINGTGNSDIRLKLTGNILYTSTLNNSIAWKKELHLKAGRYYIKFYKKSGSTTVTNTPYVRGYDTSNTQLFQVNCDSSYTLELEEDTDILINQWCKSGTYIKAEYCMEIYDLDIVKNFNEVLSQTDELNS